MTLEYICLFEKQTLVTCQMKLSLSVQNPTALEVSLHVNHMPREALATCFFMLPKYNIEMRYWLDLGYVEAYFLYGQRQYIM